MVIMCVMNKRNLFFIIKKLILLLFEVFEIVWLKNEIGINMVKCEICNMIIMCFFFLG